MKMSRQPSRHAVVDSQITVIQYPKRHDMCLASTVMVRQMLSLLTRRFRICRPTVFSGGLAWAVLERSE